MGLDFSSYVGRVKSAASGVDVVAVRLNVEEGDVPAQAAEEFRSNGGRGSVGAVGDDAEACKREAGDGIDEELDVVGLKGGVVLNGRQGGGIGGCDLRGVVEDFVFHGQFHYVGQLEAVRAEELDAVVLPGIVRGGDDDPGLKSVLADEEGDGGRGYDAGAFDAGSGGAEAGGDGGGDPGA